MKVIHAYRRKESTTVELFGLSIEFKPNDKKDVVAEVEHEEAAERLLSISEAYRLYTGAFALSALTTRIQDSEDVVTTGASQVNFDLNVQHLQALDARVTSLAAQVTAAEGVLTSRATALEALQINLDSTAEFPGVTVSTGGEQLANTDDAGQSAAQDQTQSDTGGVASPYVFSNESGESIDISTWTAKEIREFAEANEIELPKGNSVKVGELRDLLTAALTKE